MGIAPYLFVPTKFVLHSILEAIKNMKKLHFTCVSVMTMLNFIETTTTIATTTLINTIIRNAIVGECLLLFVLTLE